MTVIAVMFPWDHKYFEKYEIACYFRHFCTHCLHVAITFQQDCTLNENNCNASLVIVGIIFTAIAEATDAVDAVCTQGDSFG